MLTLFDKELRPLYLDYVKQGHSDSFWPVIDHMCQHVILTYLRDCIQLGVPSLPSIDIEQLEPLDMWLIDYQRPQDFYIKVNDLPDSQVSAIGSVKQHHMSSISLPLNGISAVHVVIIPFHNRLYFLDNWSRQGTCILPNAEYPAGQSSVPGRRQLMSVPRDQFSTILLGPKYALLINPPMCQICYSYPRICRLKCGHVVNCVKCLYKLENCCICRATMRPSVTITPDDTITINVSSSRHKRPRQWSPEYDHTQKTFLPAKKCRLIE